MANDFAQKYTHFHMLWICWNLTFQFVISCCENTVVRFRHKYNLVMIRKTWRLGLQYLVWSLQTQLDISQIHHSLLLTRHSAHIHVHHTYYMYKCNISMVCRNVQYQHFTYLPLGCFMWDGLTIKSVPIFTVLKHNLLTVRKI